LRQTRRGGGGLRERDRILLEIRNVTKIFNPGSVNEIEAIRSLNLTAGEGELVTVIGSNGAGKSTLLGLIAGTFRPDEGEIHIGGERVTMWPEHRRATCIGRVFQNPLTGTCASMTIEENFALAGRRGLMPGLSRGVRRRDRCELRKRLGILGLGLENRLKDKVGLLSGGQRQSLTLLMATLRRPELLLLDEHTAALDPRTADQVLAITRDLIRDMKLTTVMVTHNMKQAIELGDRLVMMHQGRIVLDVSGERKQRLTVQELLNEFAGLKAGEIVDDELLLV
jgi:putative ABC transport system ATP-binding protein